MYTRSIILPALASLVSAVAAEDQSLAKTGAEIFARQNDPDSTCTTFGVDFQDGGSYFINTNSNESFTAVSKFEGCNNDQASILLVNEATSDEYECTSVDTVPDNEAMLSTCPVLKSALTSGDYLILALGNNGNGNPFAFQREFSIEAGPQQTSTVTPTATYSVTITPTLNFETTSTVFKTSSINNTLTVTKPATTQVTTTTPAEVTVTSTSTNTRTFWRWTSTQSVSTVSVTPSCTVPIRPRFPDPPCRFIPKHIPLPFGLNIFPRGDKPVDVEYVRKRFENHRAAKARAAAEQTQAEAAPKSKRQMVKREADDPTVTVTADSAVNTTTTVTGEPTTITDLEITSSTIYTTLPPETVQYGTKTNVITAPTPTDTVQKIDYTRDYATKTWAVTWTRTVTTTPEITAAECKRQGGHFGSIWGGRW